MCTLMQNPVSNCKQGTTYGCMTSNSRPINPWWHLSPARVKNVLWVYPCTNSWQQLRHRLVESCSSGKQLNSKSSNSTIQSLSIVNQNSLIAATRLVRGRDSCVVPSSISSRGVRNVPVLRGIQVSAELSSETCDSRVGGIMNCHLNRHADTVKTMRSEEHTSE